MGGVRRGALTSEKPAWPRRLLALVGTAVLLGATALWVDVDAVAASLSSARVGPVLVALGISLPLMVVLAARWSFTARRVGLDLPFWLALREYYGSVLLNRTVPGGVVGDIGRAVRGGLRSPEHKGAAVRSVVLERLSGQVVLWGFVAIGVLAWGLDGGPQMLMRIGAGLGVLLVVLVVVLRIDALRTSAFGRALVRLGAELRSAFVDRGAWAIQLALSTVSVLLLGATFAACTVAVGAPVEPLQLMFIAPVLFAVASLPVSVGGWGVREAAAASLYAAASLDPADGVAASAVYGAVNIVAALPGALTWLRSARADAA